MSLARPARAVLALLLPLALTATACSKGAAAQDPTQELAAAKKALDTTSGVHLSLRTDRLPSGVDGLLSADGDATHAPAFKGSIKVAASGLTADVKVIAVDGAVHAVLPFQTAYSTVNPGDYGAPDPAALMRTDGGLSSLLTAARGVTAGKQQRDGKDVLSTYDATVPGRAVASIIPSADAKKGFDATFTVDGDHRLHEAILTGPFYPKGGNVTYTIEFSHYGSSPSITAP
ncbi:MAG: LppX_LprAFG lipoprotein [Nocardioides sp.]